MEFLRMTLEIHLAIQFLLKFNLDSDFFKDKYVILFDDVITTGASVERFKNKMENAGATVIAALSVGKTKHERQNTQPIYNLI